LNVHMAASMASQKVYCLPDGTRSVITDGPQSADGYTWFRLDGLGWVVSDYLAATGPANSVSDSSSTPAATPPSNAPPATSTPGPPPPRGRPGRFGACCCLATSYNAVAVDRHRPGDREATAPVLVGHQ